MVKHFTPIDLETADLALQPSRGELSMSRLDQMVPGNSAPMRNLKQLITLLAPAGAPVLIQGASGSGKELVAQALHSLSGRKGQIVAVNCAAIPADLLEGELFGAERGAYTGADRSREGLFEQAQGGTLFLDEIGDLPLAMQAKLLRVLETRSLRRLGGTASVQLDFRLVAATHRDLEKMVANGSFREDLFFRLSVFPVQVPALRDRLDDLPLLIETLLHAETRGQRTAEHPVFDASALRALCARDWAGNVRELKTLIQRALLLFPGRKVTAREISENLVNFACPRVQAPDWPEPPSPQELAQDNPARLADVFRKGTGRIDLRSYLRDIEILMITAALEEQQDCVSRAAMVLGLHRTTLIEKMRKYGVNVAREKH